MSTQRSRWCQCGILKRDLHREIGTMPPASVKSQIRTSVPFLVSRVYTRARGLKLVQVSCSLQDPQEMSIASSYLC